MRQIEEWLGDLWVGEYASRFAENHIDLLIDRDLGNQDLKELGVASLGHRRKLFGTIYEPNASPTETVSAVKPPSSPPEKRTAPAEPEPIEDTRSQDYDPARIG